MMRRLAALLLAALVVVVVGSFASATVPVDNHSPVKISGCAVRLLSTPYLHQNAAHSCAGFTSAAYDAAGRLVVTFDGGCVRSVSLSPDETMVRKGIAAGGSGGNTSLVIFFAHDGVSMSAHDPYLHGTNTNVWITVINEDTDVCAGIPALAAS